MPPKVTLSYKLKLEILDYAKKTSISEASRKYAVERQNIRKWKLKEAEMRAFLKFCKPQKFFEACLSQWFVYIYNHPPPNKNPWVLIVNRYAPLVTNVICVSVHTIRIFN